MEKIRTNVTIGLVGKYVQKPEQQWKDSGEFSVYVSCYFALALWLFPLPHGCKLLFRGPQVSW